MRKQLFCVLLSAGCVYADSTWTGSGADSNWSNVVNWAENQVPSGGLLSFGGSARLTNTNNLTDLSVSGLLFSSGAGGFSLGGNPLTIRGFIKNNSTSSQTVGMPLTLNGDLLLTVPGTGNLNLTNTISGSGNLYRSGNGSVSLYAPNTFTGDIYHSNSWFLVGNSQALGNPSNVFYQLNYDTSLLVLDSNVTIPNKLVMFGSQNNGALVSQNAKTNTITGTLVTTNQFRALANGGSVLHIKGGVEALGTGNNLFVLNANDNGEIRFSDKPLIMPYRQFYADAGIVTLAVAGNQWASLMKAGSTLRLDVPNCLPGDKAVNIGIGYAQLGTIDLNGNDQIFGGLYGINDPTKGLTLVKSDTPAVLTVNQVASGNTSSYDGNFAGALGIVKVGSLDLIVTGTNCTHTGPLTIGQGVVAVKSVGPVGVGTGSFNPQQLVISNNATFRLASYTGIASNQVLPATHGVWVPSGTGTVEVVSARELRVDGPVGGAGTLNKTGGGSLLLRGGFNGDKMVVSAGSVRMSTQMTEPVSVLSGASFGYQLSTSPVTAESLIPAGSTFASGSLIALDASQTLGQFLQVDGVFSDQSGNSVGLEKVNAGTVLLTGASTYTGETRISGGTLRINSFPLNDEASPIGIASTNSGVAKLNFAGGTLEYAGLTNVITYRLFTRSSGQWAQICVTNAGTTLWIANYQRSNGILIKTGEGTLRLTRDNAQGSGANISGGPNYILGGVLETAADDVSTGRFRIQQNIGLAESSGPAIRFGDGGTLRYDIPLQLMTHGARQLVDYVGTSRRGIIENGLTICAPDGEPGNTITFAINDGADDIDFVTKSTLNPYPGATGYSSILKTGDGTWKTAGSGCRGAFTIRAGRMLVSGDITASGVGSPLGTSTNRYGVLLGDSLTVSTNRPSVIYDGAASSFSYVRGTYVHTNAYAQIGSVSNIAVTINANIGLDGILGFYSATLGNTFAVNCALNGIGGIAKTGPGVVNLNVANGYAGSTIVESGTLRVNADGAVPNGRNLVLNGGYLNLNGRIVSFGTLTVGGDASIDAAQGLVFADSSSTAWNGKLTFANRTKAKIYFGTTASGLTATQVAKIAVPAGCQKLKMGVDGELIFVPKGSLVTVR